jgi:hypothetical protein
MPWIDGLSNVPEGGLKFNIKTVQRKGELILTLSLSGNYYWLMFGGLGGILTKILPAVA